ncbi:hypothetical protein [Flavobacterium sp. JP2137]|uniref:hypothetical protein n=1 Tax=Flavobacterium sp. JP2137 TaxID=3414510 RepID=UPI003D2FD669
MIYIKTLWSFLLIVTIVLGGCVDKKSKNNAISNLDKVLTKEIKNSRIKYEIDFPDTVYVNEENFGLINYESSFDSISTKFGEGGTNRYVRLIMTTTNRVDYDNKYLKSIVKDTFGAYDNRTIDFLLIFREPGVFYMDGVINDLVMMDIKKKDKEGNELIRWLEDEVRVTKKVIVLNKDASK